MTSSKDIAFTSNAKSAISNSLLIAYGSKSVELKTMKDAMSMYRDSLLDKERILEEEKRKLEELHYRVWSLEDSFCEQVWQFSHKHDFSVIFKYHPFFMSHCAKERNNNKDERSLEVIDLINEIDILRTKISNFNYTQDVKREVENAVMKLRKLQLVSDDITELLKLINNPSESSHKFTTISMPIYEEIIPNNENKIRRSKNDLNYENMKNRKIHGSQKGLLVKNKSCLKSDKSSVIFNKKADVTMIPNNYPQLFLERSIIFTEKTTIMNISTASTSPVREKLKSFTLKKRSKISTRFEQHRKRHK